MAELAESRWTPRPHEGDGYDAHSPPRAGECGRTLVCDEDGALRGALVQNALASSEAAVAPPHAPAAATLAVTYAADSGAGTSGPAGARARPPVVVAVEASEPLEQEQEKTVTPVSRATDDDELSSALIPHDSRGMLVAILLRLA
jgi:hypothetical protein